MRRISLYRQLLLILFAVVFTLSTSITIVLAESPQSESIKLKVLLLPYIGFAPFFIAQEEGYFTEQKLEIEFVKMNRIADAIPALAQGELDVAAGTINIGILNAIDRGGTIKIVAGKGHEPGECVYTAFMARQALVKAGELNDPVQLRGRRINMTSAGIPAYLIEKVLRKDGLTLKDLEIKYVPPPVKSDALETGAVDVVYGSEPWITRFLKAGNAVVWLPIKEISPEFQLAFILYGPGLFKENRDAGNRFMVAYLKAVQQYNLGKTTRNMEILNQYTGLTREFLQEICWPAIYDDGHINVNSVLDFQKWGLEKGLLDRIVTEDLFWDRSFIDHAQQVLEIPSE